ncbi:MAG: hypothetical protein AAGJ93_02665 [Bacteroidota bacterium]
MKKINWADQLLNFLGIIVGVSLAFWINSLAQSSQEKKELQQTVGSFISELDFDIAVYEKNSIPDNKRQLLIIDSMIMLVKSGKIQSLDGFKAAFRYNNYYPQCVTFNSISNSGKLDLIKDFEVRKQIIVYHEIVASEAQWKGNNQVEFNKSYIQSMFINEFDFLNPDVSQINVVKMQNLLFLYRVLLSEKVRQYEFVVKNARELRESLSELQ